MLQIWLLHTNIEENQVFFFFQTYSHPIFLSLFYLQFSLDGLIVSHLPHGPTTYFSLCNCVLRHDIETSTTIPEQYPQLIFHNFKKPLGIRIRNVLQALFPVPKPDSKRVITFYNNNDFISFRHHTFSKNSKGEIELEEIGPRFEMRVFRVTLGTVDIKDPDVEFALCSFIRSAKRSTVL